MRSLEYCKTIFCNFSCFLLLISITDMYVCLHMVICCTVFVPVCKMKIDNNGNENINVHRRIIKDIPTAVMIHMIYSLNKKE